LPNIIRNERIETVAAPAIGGLIIGYAVAEALNARFIWTERENDANDVAARIFRQRKRTDFSCRRRDYDRRLDARMYRGAGTRGAKVIAAASIIDRSGGAADVGVPRVRCSLEVPSYNPKIVRCASAAMKRLNPEAENENQIQS
jgi:orotate phosphoribosyltransferase